MRKLRMTIGKATLDAELFDTPTAEALLAAAPFETRATKWEGEVYFTVPVRAEREAEARDVIEPGELAFRVEGEVVVIGFGPTPASQAGEIRLAMPANVWGRTDFDVSRLDAVEPGDLIRIEPAQEA
ncbi:cyclophilin-like fold protein [Magnetospirillum sp. UT-4]|uniref:cyclophilin-like fold protein n=1 Tax=Magnetospirillum sp. UT-4 TaxID=2681467 RepID=UPI001384CE17|nr:cyclophilin-like fold protein [Magnetospirillum sp. UT-4]CAA7625923.1 conserved hypothetical protein [Magnetospirillum sp. UT-4]